MRRLALFRQVVRQQHALARSRPWTHRSAVASGAAWEGDALTFTPVAVFEGPFRLRNGTPRQGALVPSARGTVRLLRDALAHGARDSLAGLDDYSHVILLWAFHANRPSRTLTKVAPPRLGGAKQGVFATRSPHRPNPIGLSVVKLESVDADACCVHVTGADLLHGTPILDIKPYLPSYDAHPHAHIPHWLAAAPATAPLTVTWSPAALAALEVAAPALRFLRSPAEVRAAAEEALRSELRSAYRRTSCAEDVYGFLIDVVDLRCRFDDAARAVEVLEAELCPYANADDAGVAPADAATFAALLGPGLACRVSDAGSAHFRVNGVLLGVPVEAAGRDVLLRYDWRAGVLCCTASDGVVKLGRWDAHELTASQARGAKALRALGLYLLAGPLPGGSHGWLRPGAKLGAAALWDVLDARPRLALQQYEAYGRQQELA